MTAFVGANLNDTLSPSQRAISGNGFGLGDRYVDSDGKEFVYVQASASIALNDVVSFTTAYAATTLTTSNGARGNLVGVAVAAFAANDFGWVQVKGPATMNVLASCAANIRLNTTATAGSLDDDGTTGAKQVQGAYLASARAASNGPAAGFLNYPFVDVTI